MTLPDVDVVVDLGLSRSIGSYHALLCVEDFAASEGAQEQRKGRAGRVKPGCSVRVQVADRVPPPAALVLRLLGPSARTGAIPPEHFSIQIDNVSTSAVRCL